MTHTRRDFLRRCGSGALIAAATVPRPAASGRLVAEAVDHVDVWRETGRYGGWPANHGMWAWGDELLVGFTAGVLKTGDPMRHPIDRSAGEQQALARSRDGGRSWTFEAPATLQAPPRPEHRARTGEPLRLPAVRTLEQALDFRDPRMALTFRAAHGVPGAWLYASRDRGAVWEGPYQVPAFDTPGLDPRTDYLVTGPRTVIAGMTAFKPNGKEGRPLAIQTRDGGRTWQRLGWIGPETDGFRIMPALARLGDDELYAVVRRRDGQRHSLEGYRSDDAGLTWTFTTRVVPSATSPPRSGHPLGLMPDA